MTWRGVGGGVLIIFCFLLLPVISFADEIIYPFPIYTERVLKDAKDAGYDLSGSDDSIGHLENKGTEFHIYTYYSLEYKELEAFKKIVMRNIRESYGKHKLSKS